MVEITKENFTAALEAAVEEKGADYVYPEELMGKSRYSVTSCLYFDNETHQVPLCIIGNALARLGLTYDDIVKLGTDNVNVLENEPPIDQDIGASSLLTWLTNDSDLATAAQAAQNAQDRGQSWGVALERFKEYL